MYTFYLRAFCGRALFDESQSRRVLQQTPLTEGRMGERENSRICRNRRRKDTRSRRGFGVRKVFIGDVGNGCYGWWCVLRVENGERGGAG